MRSYLRSGNPLHRRSARGRRAAFRAIETLEPRRLLSADLGGDSFALASPITPAIDYAIVRDFVSSPGDRRDYYTFDLPDEAEVTIRLDKVTDDADVRLYDATLTRIGLSNRAGTATDRITANLSGGTYFILVHPSDVAATHYRLGVLQRNVDRAGKGLGDARDLGALPTGTTVAADRVGPDDTIDTFRFELAEPTQVTTQFADLSDRAEARLLDASGATLARIFGDADAPGILQRTLQPGVYYQRVRHLGAMETNFTLELATLVGDRDGDPIEDGVPLGPVGASGLSVRDNVGDGDALDVFRFDVTEPGSAIVRLTELTGNVDLFVYDGARNLLGSSREGQLKDEMVANLGLEPGTYFFEVEPFMGMFGGYLASIEFTPQTALAFAETPAGDASRDATFDAVFESGALRLGYDTGLPAVSSVRAELVSGSTTTVLGTWTQARRFDELIDLSAMSVPTGPSTLRFVATVGDSVTFEQAMPFEVLPLESLGSQHDFMGSTFAWSGSAGSGTVALGAGGTDTLLLSGVNPGDILSINGAALDAFDPHDPTQGQAIYGGTAYDFIALNDGREIYFQGMERIEFADATVVDLAVAFDDTAFPDQWNLHITDVPTAWRFTRGSGGVLLVSLDTGLMLFDPNGNAIDPFDLDFGQLELLPNPFVVNDGLPDPGHGTQVVSILAGIPGNGEGVAGINHVSTVQVFDLYAAPRTSLHAAIDSAVRFARQNGLKVVFQGGIQGESWFTDGGQRADLIRLLNNSRDVALYAMAAGNGGVDVDQTFFIEFDDMGNPTVNRVLTAGVARLQTSIDNVMAVGAMERTATMVHGLSNASAVNLASYSNRGANLTMVAPTDTPAALPPDLINTFNGTSAANPNMAGIASLVWSVNPSLSGTEVRFLLTSTAMDIGAAGDDALFGNGLVNADAALRRALALTRDRALALLGDPQTGLPVSAPALPASIFVGDPADALAAKVAPAGAWERPIAFSSGRIRFSGHEIEGAIDLLTPAAEA